jgi:hypothetical protein
MAYRGFDPGTVILAAFEYPNNIYRTFRALSLVQLVRFSDVRVVEVPVSISHRTRRCHAEDKSISIASVSST